ncbi:MAG: hypothetical protein KAK04_12500 [Cyclobacteriaceae bacterium]|nr:hypothetical protein [Cyclobacteriaceae bacterium]
MTNKNLAKTAGLLTCLALTQFGILFTVTEKPNSEKTNTLLFIVDEAGIKTPLIFVWEGVINLASKYKELVSSIDHTASFFEIAGIEHLSSNLPLDCRSIKTGLEGGISEQWQSKSSLKPLHLIGLISK